MTKECDITKTIKQVQSIIAVETKSIKSKGTAGEGKLVALSKLCNSLRSLVQLTLVEIPEDDMEGYSDPDYRKRWRLE